MKKSFCIASCAVLILLIMGNSTKASGDISMEIKDLPDDVQKSIVFKLKQNEKPIESQIKDGIVMTEEEFEIYKKNLAKAVMVYSKYHKSGASVGKYTETVSGTVLKDNVFSIDAKETKLKRKGK